MVSGALIPQAWERHLPQDDPERGFIMEGVKCGFRITNMDTTGAGAYHKNHRSATCKENRQEVEEHIEKELINGRYIKVDERPTIVSALAAISKGEGKGVRLIHDASRPTGQALNDYSINTAFRFHTIQEAGDSIQRGDWLAKLDVETLIGV